ncbi:Wzz/FepE/Etk N-terminal domain-containing protein [Amylibacter sp.]|nr:Wzz/FepE/Etk N-terminal domain-containing protein [Amylibacter sp.]
MQDYPNTISDDEIDLREIFMALWAYKIFIAIVCAIGVFVSVYFILNTNKKFTSVAIFQVNTGSNGLLNSGRFNALMNLTGVGTDASNLSVSNSKINGRVFVKKIDTELNFQADPYFYKHNSEKTVDPLWKSIIKRALGWQAPTETADEQEVIWQSITSIFSNNLDMNTDNDGSIEISFTHVNPLRAAEIANSVMEEIISSISEKYINDQNNELSYLSNALAKALNGLEKSQSNLKVFAIENSALPLESFAAESIRLDSLREQLSRTTELYEAVTGLSLVLKNKTTDHPNYLLLRQKFPIIDQVEFRRVLGQNEIIRSWSWPNLNSVMAVLNTLSDRKNRLQSQINTSQKDAEQSSIALETYSKLQREAKIAEASYTVLIEQVKAQSMMAGYRPSNAEVYEYASPSTSSSSPNRKLILAIGTFFGLLTGCTIAIIMATSRGVFFSKKSLMSTAQAQVNKRAKTLTSLRNKSLVNKNLHMRKKPKPFLRDIVLEIHKSGTNQAVVTSSRSKIKANIAAQALALTMQSKDTNIAVIDFSEKNTNQKYKNSDTASVGSFITSETVGGVNVLRPEGDLDPLELISQKDFLKNIKLLNSNFSLVFLCADNDDAITLLRALEGQKLFHLTLVKTKRTKSDDLIRMRSLLPIQGLLHD